MSGIHFSWDPKKNESNQGKHGISFEEACDVFLDEEALLIPDPDHSESEERFIILGMSLKAKIIAVCHCYPDHSENKIRIISARKATKIENVQYFKRLR